MINKVNKIISDKEAVIACDLFLPLRFYYVPEWLQESLKSAFPAVRIVPVNSPNNPITDKSATVYWGNRITSEIINKMPNLDWIHFGSVGVNRINVKEMSDKNILVSSSKGLVVSSMVASALAFMTNLARGMHYNHILQSKGVMSRYSFDKYYDKVHELSNEHCLIVGFGNVGEKLARVCKALEMKVTAISRSLDEHEFVDEFYTLDNLSKASSDADYIVNLLPLNSETNQVFTIQTFNKMKSSAFFINIGRGETVDEDALILALKSNRIAGAGLDVFSQEPLDKESQLFSMENVVLSPHIAGLSSGYWNRQGELFIENLKCYLENNYVSMRNIVDSNYKVIQK
jgi:phosphoglycerate dehydrogenase-like enzyme